MKRRLWAAGILLLSLDLGFGGSAGAQDPGSEQAPATAEPEKLNPFTGDSLAIAEGRKLFLKYNCYGCHGTMGGGGMGKPINDTEWAYGGDDASVLETIQGGRPGGMPVFGELITKDDIWKIIAYIRSFYKGDTAAIKW